MMARTTARTSVAATQEKSVAKASGLDCVPLFTLILFSLDGGCCSSGYGHFLNRKYRILVNAELVRIALRQVMEPLVVVPMAKFALDRLVVAVEILVAAAVVAMVEIMAVVMVVAEVATLQRRQRQRQRQKRVQLLCQRQRQKRVQLLCQRQRQQPL
jgi:hypothetical protein